MWRIAAAQPQAGRTARAANAGSQPHHCVISNDEQCCIVRTQTIFGIYQKWCDVAQATQATSLVVKGIPAAIGQAGFNRLFPPSIMTRRYNHIRCTSVEDWRRLPCTAFCSLPGKMRHQKHPFITRNQFSDNCQKGRRVDVVLRIGLIGDADHKVAISI